jgi:flagellin-like hook-associated protein FlgL
MKDFLKPYYQRIKDILVEASTEDVDLEELTFEVDKLKDEFYNELESRSTSTEFVFEGEDAVKGLIK